MARPPPPDNKMAIEVVDRLKKQGLFDQFRKECLADVDTTPTYQNLTHRVEANVQQFLSQQRWRPDLNKNQLRENLRRHLTDSHMLSAGIERVVDQVVKPKIVRDFKSQIDKVVCEYLGLSYDEWLAKQNEPRVKRVFMRSGVPVPSFLDTLHQSRPPGEGPFLSSDIPPFHGTHLPPPLVVLPPQPGFGSLSIPPHLPPPPDLHPHMVGGGVNAVLPHDLHLGMPPGGPTMGYPPFDPMSGGYFNPQFPNVGYSGAMMPFPGLPPAGGGFPLPGIFPPPPGTTAMDAGATAQSQDVVVETKPLGGAAGRKLRKLKKRKEEEEARRLAAEALLNVPLPQSAPPPKPREPEGLPPPSPEDSKDSLQSTPWVVTPTELSQDSFSANDAKVEQPGGGDAMDESLGGSQDAVGGLEDPPVATQKEYHFAWDDVQADDLSVSSVHTSDLSSFDENSDEEERGNGGEVKLEVEESAGVEGKGQEGRKGGVGDVAEEEIAETSTNRNIEYGVEDRELDLPGSEEDRTLSNQSDAAKAAGASLIGETSEARVVVENPPGEVAGGSDKQKVEGGGKVGRGGARRRLGARFDADDESEEEETREQRKARMANEKEERCFRRQQRRVELETKRKEKDEEKKKNRRGLTTTQQSENPACDDTANVVEASALPDAVTVAEASLLMREQETADTAPAAEEIIPESTSSGVAEKARGEKEEEEEDAADDFSPRKTRSGRAGNTKQRMKEELREKKVLEKKRELGRRQRTVNPKYLSADFTSMFSERLLSSSAAGTDPTDEALEVGAEQESFEECVVEEEIVLDQSAVEIEQDLDQSAVEVEQDLDQSVVGVEEDLDQLTVEIEQNLNQSAVEIQQDLDQSAVVIDQGNGEMTEEAAQMLEQRIEQAEGMEEVEQAGMEESDQMEQEYDGSGAVQMEQLVEIEQSGDVDRSVAVDYTSEGNFVYAEGSYAVVDDCGIESSGFQHSADVSDTAEDSLPEVPTDVLTDVPIDDHVPTDSPVSTAVDETVSISSESEHSDRSSNRNSRSRSKFRRQGRHVSDYSDRSSGERRSRRRHRSGVRRADSDGGRARRDEGGKAQGEGAHRGVDRGHSRGDGEHSSRDGGKRHQRSDYHHRRQSPSDDSRRKSERKRHSSDAHKQDSTHGRRRSPSASSSAHRSYPVSQERDQFPFEVQTDAVSPLKDPPPRPDLPVPLKNDATPSPRQETGAGPAEGSDDEECESKPKKPVDSINFGEAAKRSTQRCLNPDPAQRRPITRQYPRPDLDPNPNHPITRQYPRPDLDPNHLMPRDYPRLDSNPNRCDAPWPPEHGPWGAPPPPWSSGAARGGPHWMDKDPGRPWPPGEHPRGWYDEQGGYGDRGWVGPEGGGSGMPPAQGMEDPWGGYFGGPEGPAYRRSNLPPPPRPGCYDLLSPPTDSGDSPSLLRQSSYDRSSSRMNDDDLSGLSYHRDGPSLRKDLFAASENDSALPAQEPRKLRSAVSRQRVQSPGEMSGSSASSAGVNNTFQSRRVADSNPGESPERVCAGSGYAAEGPHGNIAVVGEFLEQRGGSRGFLSGGNQGGISTRAGGLRRGSDDQGSGEEMGEGLEGRTRASRRRSEAENAPIAKRLRR